MERRRRSSCEGDTQAKKEVKGGLKSTNIQEHSTYECYMYCICFYKSVLLVMYSLLHMDPQKNSCFQVMGVLS